LGRGFISLALLLRGEVLGISILGKGLGLLEISIVISNLLLGISILLVEVLVLLVGVFFLSSSSYSITSYLVVTLGIRYRAL